MTSVNYENKLGYPITEGDDNVDKSNDAQQKKEDREQVIMLGSDITKSSKGNIYTLTIIGQVEGHQVLPETAKTTKYEHVLPLLAGIEESEEIDGLLFLLNTVGGDIEAGLAIAELISGMKTKTASLILGGSHSIGVPLAVSTDRSFIVPTASMTIHPVRMNGLILGVPQTLVYLQKMEDRVVNFVTRHTDISKERFRELMLNNDELVSDFGTVLDGESAVNEGLIDQIGGLSDALSFLIDD